MKSESSVYLYGVVKAQVTMDKVSRYKIHLGMSDFVSHHYLLEACSDTALVV